MLYGQRGRAARRAGLLAAVAILLTAPLWPVLGLPDHVRLVRGQPQELRLPVPVPVTVRAVREGPVLINGNRVGPAGLRFGLAGHPLELAAADLGQAELDFALFGLLPLRRMKVDVVPPIRLMAGGHSIGVVLRMDGVLVVGHGGVTGPGGQSVWPGREAGIEVGDLILAIDGTPVTGEAQVAGLIDEAGRAGRAVQVTLRRRGRTLVRVVHPVQDRDSGRWRVGLYIRDGTAGVGTLTFYDPQTRVYGALGHIVADSDTGQPLPVREGRVVRAAVVGIDQAQRGRPGEKVTEFIEVPWLGTLDRNTRVGVFGTLRELPPNPVYPDPVPVAMGGQVREGPAEILTVVRGQTVERFAAEILRVNPGAAEGKNLVVRITDPRLLDRTQGIVQGMSGSPILQNGHLVGAVTHVFVNDPARGYGVLIESMLQEAGLLPAPGQAGPLGNSRGLPSAPAA